MDPFKSNIDCFDKNNMFSNLQEFEINNQKTEFDENEKNEVIKSSVQNCEIVSSDTDITDKNDIIVLDYNTVAGMKINNNYLFNNLKPKMICLYKLNISYNDIVKTFKEKLMSKIVDGKYIMSNKDAINLDKMIGLACIAMNESEKNNKRLKTRNAILNTKCAKYDSVVKECSRLKSELDKIIINLCLALGRRVNDKEDVMHLINVCAALFARDSEYHYIQMENDKSKYTLNKQLMDIRVKTLNNYDEILNSMNRFSEEMYIKDLKISQLMDDLSSINIENEKKDGIIQLLKDKFSEFSDKFINVDYNFDDGFDDSQKYNEMYEGKLLISEQINQLLGSKNIEAESYQLSDLINILLKVILDKEELLADINRQQADQNQQLMKEQDNYKEWQKHLENANEKLNSEIENQEHIIKMLTGKENDHNNLKKNHSKLQQMYDELNKDDTHLRILTDKYKRQLSEKEIKCIDSDILIKTLQLNLTELANQFERANSMYKNEKEKCQKIESHVQETIEEFTAQIHKKNIDIASIRDECYTLKDQISSDKAEIDNLKQRITTLDFALNEKNKTIQELLKNSNKPVKSSLQFKDNVLTLSELNKQSNNDIVLYNSIQQQPITNSNWITRHQNVIDEILLNHQKEIKRLKKEYDSNITHLTDTEVSLKNEIQNLKESLKLKSAQIIMVEKIANSQLKEASNMIQHLNQTTTISQSLELNGMKNRSNVNMIHISDKNNVKYADSRRFKQMECTQDLLFKLIWKNKAMKKLCQIRQEKIRYLENCINSGTQHKKKF